MTTSARSRRRCWRSRWRSRSSGHSTTTTHLRPRWRVSPCGSLLPMPPTDPPGPLLGAGRSADVYALGPGRVLRRYRVPIDVAAEARLMRYLAASGYPVPEVYDADGRDLVLERLDGTDMLKDLGRRPWLVA